MRNGRFVILGNGGAAVSAAEAARLSGYRGEILLVSDVAEPAFNPMLSPYYFKGKIPWAGCYPLAAGFYRDHDVACRLGEPVVALDPDRRRITLGDGRTVAYDACLIATGAAPAVPPIPGLRESAHAFTLRNAASARRLDEQMLTARRAIVFGVSLVGMKMAEILARRGIAVVLLGRGRQVLSRGTHPAVAAVLRRYIEARGVDVRLGCTIAGVEDTGNGVLCRLSDGTTEPADILLVCTGIRPNLAFLDCGQVTIDQAVLTDERMRTSADGLYAAGDACQALNPITGRHDWLGTWGNACAQGRVAGRQVAGVDAALPGALPQHVSPFFDWTYAHVGDIQPGDGDVRHVAFGDAEDGGYALFSFRDGIVTGANMINCAHLAGPLKSAILRGARGDERLLRGGDGHPLAAAESILDGCRLGRLDHRQHDGGAGGRRARPAVTAAGAFSPP
ncbi:NAD(P)/FAD-dependent oxidoreductase [Rhodoplanes sp. TEM]|uniref:NAD(P)/FAD-dependent oxidoreductase n=1 Tax=Rhodoplanes tepidamans TaxID=200616 RepID=A0ABT5JGG2_RHOTP|nr:MULTISPECIES: NAD(P)/FAD-dependent oxidoreductase [Rhodoplanes]MDC7788800.1 NAD(P)/FAD-dependent oxidoreductase [Rhodoplanes tepidamans]MDC7984132.1 NAD(P)/FAD-dependent oxidoreductase [Rhodoplanes sp. TEM]MDQ0356888.1 3-phenylpropionate/trans-cinnamate dioxygenase ferredoxin reductase subunit [Rhodoplanes tepidamans]